MLFNGNEIAKCNISKQNINIANLSLIKQGIHTANLANVLSRVELLYHCIAL